MIGMVPKAKHTRSSDLDAIVEEFVVESGENLDRLEHDLVELEKNPAAKDTLGSVFRTIHSIKGATGFLGLSKLGAVAHAGENLLSRLRDGVFVINPGIASGLLALADSIRRMLSSLDQTGDEGDADDTALIERLTRLAQDGGVAEAAPVAADQARSEPAIAPVESVQSAPAAGNIRVGVEQLDALMNLVGELVLTRNEMLQFSLVQQNPILLGASQRLNAITTQLQEGTMKTRMQPIDNVWNKFPRLVRDLALLRGKQVRLEMDGK